MKQGLVEYCLTYISKQANHSFTVQTTTGLRLGLWTTEFNSPLITTSGLRALKTLLKHADFNVKLTGGVYRFPFLYCKLTFGSYDQETMFRFSSNVCGMC